MTVEQNQKSFQITNENCQKNVLDLEDSLVTSSRQLDRPQKRPEIKHRTLVLWYNQLMAAGGLQVLQTSNEV